MLDGAEYKEGGAQAHREPGRRARARQRRCCATAPGQQGSCARLLGAVASMAGSRCRGEARRGGHRRECKYSVVRCDTIEALHVSLLVGYDALNDLI